MALPFLDRKDELGRLRARLRGSRPSFCCLYGRRRVGKSRLINEALRGLPAVYYIADERDPRLQRRSLAEEIGRLLPGFGDVEYPGWVELLERFQRDAPDGTVLVIDELPSLVAHAPELPSILQRHVDHMRRPLHLVVCGSSQRMMQGLVLDGNAPLYGRAHELLKVEPLRVSEALTAFRTRNPERAIEAFSVFGGIPRYWELAREHRTVREAIRHHVLDPHGVLHREPDRLLMDDLRDPAQATSILSLVGQGSHRMSEIAGRLGQPSTSLSRPLARLLDLGLLARHVPFGTPAKDAKRSLYRIRDPFLRFWYRFVQPHLSQLERGAIGDVEASIDESFPHHVGTIWEDLVREVIPRMTVGGRTYGAADSWWGTGSDAKRLELDVVAQAGKHALVGEVKLSASSADVKRLIDDLAKKAARCPALSGLAITTTVFVLRPTRAPGVVTAQDVIDAWSAS